ncbi:probable E3 ubiquitin-protein ligase RHB1A [Phalaenopsis equestris]|uniref:probable E3 ubiquitin-protein ligase RHB1A n=1 Tax=Phalaenopsis equestris TaxID=78828 RepID=UPI0009E42DBD|nr:probable E3 ubiquitin-protein ligase RHB1A [Phalaenopsis equestris]XP_020596105.1 probable E3 ubiquitin-protein ligase RHB1A [Phalaenopsis equestris]
MGGCCCRPARRTESHGPPRYFYCPEDFEENEPLSSSHDIPSAVPVLPVVPVLNTSIPDSRQEPNALLLHENFALAHSNTERAENLVKNERRQPTDTVPMGDVQRDRFEGSDKESEVKSVSEFVSNSPKIKEKLSKLEDSLLLVSDEEDVCPTCLEEYDAENPRIITKCKHHFHLSCILEWFERSNTCAICDKIMEVDNMALFDQTL